MNLKDSYKIDDFIGSIRLSQYTNEVFIIVEGETDKKLFLKLMDGLAVKIECSLWGVNGVHYAVSELLKEKIRVLGIRDADFLHLEGKTDIPLNIFLTDYHDAEMMMISCDTTYLAVTAEFLTGKEQPAHLRKNILNSIAFIGGLRWLNETENLELNFKGINFGNFYDGNTATLDEDKFLIEMMKRSKDRKRDIAKEEVILKIKDVTDFYNLCNGHDFQKALALCFNSVIKKKVTDETVGQSFRLSYSIESFKRSNLFKLLKEFSDSLSLGLFRQADLD